MHSDQMPYRELQDALSRYDGDSGFEDLLLPWTMSNSGEAEWLKSFRERHGTPIPPATQEDLWRLYAISRIFEVLAPQFQPGTFDGIGWSRAAITADQFGYFAESLGLEVTYLSRYSPFHHEIVRLLPTEEPDEPVRVVETHWPCLMLGKMMFQRAGVTVSAGSNVLVPGVADASTLYWAYWRENRPHNDLSHGWGSNSSWRTDFRRDYHLDGIFHFNVDGSVDLSQIRADVVNDFGLNPEERRELLVNRCFVVTRKEHSDLWPYDDQYSIEAA